MIIFLIWVAILCGCILFVDLNYDCKSANVLILASFAVSLIPVVGSVIGIAGYIQILLEKYL